ncbi:sn-glycerol-3-phosphate ABC transporter ATP-binding protein UgpC [Acidaminobacter sp. JC074]|uniref:ABC transporter ATP-binding protein n=1 Tax=Acidaminobacter sp. JC074 TaxID=2530199 RepID=UPI001F0DE483|nr:sn-glycerol-3-phosphate ABC transporter ATP-binding protein UgpC [Acidaminobacter sp. JC074]MCH4890888.1 sn-glycerol-3-phosphate ABC transporter ATP-binding protein UgpC [Acidaminobacter sp. JC074]
MAGLELKKINKVYPNGFHAVKGIDLEIQDKEFLVFVGPSGCGKTTSLRMIAGLEEISDGELYIGENMVNDVLPKDRNIAMVFQNYALYPHMTVYENMAFGLKLRKVPKATITEKVEKAAKILGIENLLKRRPKQLSGGQRQRVALGRAIVREPEVFLMDEPLSNLDAKLRVQMRAELIKLHQELDTTFIYVTHDQTEAMTMGTRICVMNNGLIQQVDTPREIYNHPANMFVASFIGAPQMNFMDGKVVEEGGKLFVEFEGYKKQLADEKAEMAKKSGYVGKEVVIGCRPEDIEIDSEEGFEAVIDVLELLGSETYIYFNAFGKTYIAKEGKNFTKGRGDKIKISFKSNVHAFDKENENSIF